MANSSEREVVIALGAAGSVAGTLRAPAKPRGLVIFAHGSGSSRHSPRNRLVAGALEEGGFATLLMDLLTEAEDRRDRYTAEFRFDIPRLAERLVVATQAARRWNESAGLPIGYFGASTGAAAALLAAAAPSADVAAIVSRGGRPDLAGNSLPLVRAATLLIVGGADPIVIQYNRTAMAQIRATVHLEIVPRATHLFEEPGTLEEVCRLARNWFTKYLGAGASNARPGA